MIIGKPVECDIKDYIDDLIDSTSDLVRMSIPDSEWSRRYEIVWGPVWESVINLVYNTLDDTIDM